MVVVAVVVAVVVVAGIVASSSRSSSSSSSSNTQVLPRRFKNAQNLERNIFDIKNKDASCTWEGLANTLKAQTSAQEGLFLKWCVVFEKLPVRHHAPPPPTPPEATTLLKNGG